MDSKHNTERIDPRDLCFEKSLPAPVSGCFYMEMTPDVDTKSHSSSMDADFKKIHTRITDMFPIDILSEMNKLESEKKENWLRQPEQIDNIYYEEKSNRNELIMRDEQKLTIEDVLDYQKHLQDSFEAVKVPMEDIEEEYPLFLSKSRYVAISGEISEMGDFKLERGETTLVDKCLMNGKSYKSTKLHVDDKICIEIKDGVAYYSPIQYIYRFSTS